MVRKPFMMLTNLFVAAGFYHGCASTSENSIAIELQQNAVVVVGEAAPRSVKRAQVVESNGQPVAISAPGFADVYVLPMAKGTKSVKIKLKPFVGSMSEGANAKVHRQIDELLEGVRAAQIKMANERPKVALAILDDLQNKFHDVSYLDFMRASCYVLMGNRSQALAALELGLRKQPGNEEAKALRKKLLKGH